MAEQKTGENNKIRINMINRKIINEDDHDDENIEEEPKKENDEVEEYIDSDKEELPSKEEQNKEVILSEEEPEKGSINKLDRALTQTGDDIFIAIVGLIVSLLIIVMLNKNKK